MPSNAAIYIADPSLLCSRTFDGVGGIQRFEALSEGGKASGALFEFPWGRVILNFMPEERLGSHLEGFSAYAERVIQDPERRIYAHSRIQFVRMCLGCLIEHASDDESTALQFLFCLNGELNGMMFLYDSIFDRDGQPLDGEKEV